MIGAGNQDQALRRGRGSNHCSQLPRGRELVAVAAQEKLGDGEIVEEGIPISATLGRGGQAKSDERAQVAMLCAGLATGPQRHGRAKTESHDNERKAEFAIQPIHAGLDVAGLGSAVVFALAQARAAEVEAQGRAAQSPRGIVEHLHGVIDNLVVQVAAAERVGMTDERRKMRIGRALIKNRFQLAGRTGKRKAADCAPGRVL